MPKLALHQGQQRVLASKARFKAIVAGRRWGKTYYAGVEDIIKLSDDYAPHIQVWHIAPTYAQGMDTLWPYLTQVFAPGWWTSMVRHEGKLQAPNGRWFYIKGADRPEVLAGRALSHVSLDEYAFMKPHVWEHVVRPMLSDVKGSATFIGSPEGKNHFYELFLDFQQAKDSESFLFETLDNPFIDPDEIDAARKSLSSFAYNRQYRASFLESSGAVFAESQFRPTENGNPGECYICVDLVGFSESQHRRSKYSKLDESAIAIVTVHSEGWHVEKIVHGRWSVRETVTKILGCIKEYNPVAWGMEKGVLKDALLPYLLDEMKRKNFYPPMPIALSHGNKNKQARIAASLQGRLEHGRITFAGGEYLKTLTEQAMDFPSSLTHDDLLDALSYVDQIAVTPFEGDFVEDSWEPYDEAIGY